MKKINNAKTNFTNVGFEAKREISLVSKGAESVYDTQQIGDCILFGDISKNSNALIKLDLPLSKYSEYVHSYSAIDCLSPEETKKMAYLDDLPCWECQYEKIFHTPLLNEHETILSYCMFFDDKYFFKNSAFRKHSSWGSDLSKMRQEKTTSICCKPKDLVFKIYDKEASDNQESFDRVFAEDMLNINNRNVEETYDIYTIRDPENNIAGIKIARRAESIMEEVGKAIEKLWDFNEFTICKELEPVDNFDFGLSTNHYFSSDIGRLKYICHQTPFGEVGTIVTNKFKRNFGPNIIIGGQSVRWLDDEDNYDNDVLTIKPGEYTCALQQLDGYTYPHNGDTDFGLGKFINAYIAEHAELLIYLGDTPPEIKEYEQINSIWTYLEDGFAGIFDKDLVPLIEEDEYKKLFAEVKDKELYDDCHNPLLNKPYGIICGTYQWYDGLASSVFVHKNEEGEITAIRVECGPIDPRIWDNEEYPIKTEEVNYIILEDGTKLTKDEVFGEWFYKAKEEREKAQKDANEETKRKLRRTIQALKEKLEEERYKDFLKSKNRYEDYVEYKKECEEVEKDAEEENEREIQRVVETLKEELERNKYES